MNNSAQIVHESETQRQFVRLQLPATVLIEGEKYSVKDLSSGGMALRNVGDKFQKSTTVNLVLVLPFAGFSLDIELKAEIVHIDKKSDTAGCRFIDLTAEQISILNHVIKAFMSGDIINGNEIINVVSRDNFANVRKHPANQTQSQLDNIKKYGAYGLITLATLILATFIVSNILEKLFIVKSPQGKVHANTVEMISPANGFFEMVLAEGKAGVQKGQIIGAIVTTNNKGSGLAGGPEEIPVVSPCDCLIIDQSVLNGEYKAQNASLLTLLPQDSPIDIQVNISIEEIHRLDIGTRAVIDVSGANEIFKGKVKNIKTPKDNLVTNLPPSAVVTIETDQKIPIDYLNRPAFVEFHL